MSRLVISLVRECCTCSAQTRGTRHTGKKGLDIVLPASKLTSLDSPRHRGRRAGQILKHVARTSFSASWSQGRCFSSRRSCRCFRQICCRHRFHPWGTRLVQGLNVNLRLLTDIGLLHVRMTRAPCEVRSRSKSRKLEKPDTIGGKVRVNTARCGMSWYQGILQVPRQYSKRRVSTHHDHMARAPRHMLSSDRSDLLAPSEKEHGTDNYYRFRCRR
jgi:hypothetical protein